MTALPPRRKLLLIAAGLVGAGLALCGTLLLIAPALGPDIFGLEGPTDMSDVLSSKDLRGRVWYRLIGVRQLAFGLAIVGMAAWREVRALSIMLAAGAVVPVVDAWAVGRASVSMSALVTHLVAIPVCAGLAWFLWNESKRPPVAKPPA